MVGTNGDSRNRPWICDHYPLLTADDVVARRAAFDVSAWEFSGRFIAGVNWRDGREPEAYRDPARDAAVSRANTASRPLSFVVDAAALLPRGLTPASQPEKAALP